VEYESVLAAGLVISGIGLVFEFARRRGPYRVGPWPGLTARGAGVLIGCALLLGGIQMFFSGGGVPKRAWPDLSAVAIGSLVPLVLATRVVKAPGAASAVCGAYLLPRSLASLMDAAIDPPPLVLVSAVAFDLVLWVRRSDLSIKRRVSRVPRQPTVWRGALAGAAFALSFVLVEPAYSALLGADVTAFQTADVALAAAVAVVACAALGTAMFDQARPR